MRFIQHDCVKYVETGRKISARCVFEKKQKIYARFFLFSGRNLAFLKDVGMITQRVTHSYTQLYADLAAQVGGHQFFDGFFRVAAAEQVVQLGDGGFGGHIVAADGAGLLEGVAGRVDAEFGRAAVAL